MAPSKMNLVSHDILIDGKPLDGFGVTRLVLDMPAGEFPSLTVTHRITELDIDTSAVLNGRNSGKSLGISNHIDFEFLGRDFHGHKVIPTSKVIPTFMGRELLDYDAALEVINTINIACPGYTHERKIHQVLSELEKRGLFKDDRGNI